MQAMAEELGVSLRTLRNQLARESSSYRRLVEDIRLSLAQELRSTGVSVNAIADRLGYSDASAFRAAFKRWRGGAARHLPAQESVAEVRTLSRLAGCDSPATFRNSQENGRCAHVKCSEMR